MHPKLQRRVQRYGWDKASGIYEASWSRQLEPAQDRMLQQARLQPGERVLDVACGTGLVSLKAARQVGGSGFVLGTDISASMVERATAIAANEGFANVRFERADAEDQSRAPVSDEERFDAALCGLGLMYFPEPGIAVEQMKARLRPGGRVAAAVWGARAKCGWAEIFSITDAEVHSDVCPLFFQLGTGECLAALLTDCGLQAVQVERLEVELVYDCAQAALDAAFKGGPVALAYSRFDEDTRDRVEAEYLASIDRYRDGLGYRIPGEFVVASAYRDVIRRAERGAGHPRLARGVPQH